MKTAFAAFGKRVNRVALAANAAVVVKPVLNVYGTGRDLIGLVGLVWWRLRFWSRSPASSERAREAMFCVMVFGVPRRRPLGPEFFL